MKINDWNAQQVKRAESTWGQTIPNYTTDAFEFLSQGKSFLDLGCGFGRFLGWLLNKNEEVDYIGYDSSPDMITRITERFPEYTLRCFLHNITAQITHKQESVLCSAVLIHIKLEEQTIALKNIKDIQPNYIAFDINSPSEKFLLKGDHFERIIPQGFRMTWQSHYVMTKKVMSVFNNYDLTTKFYPLHTNRHKVLYLLKKRN